MDTAQAYVWRLQNFVLGEHILTPSPEHQTPVKVISPCLYYNFTFTLFFLLERFSGLTKYQFFILNHTKRYSEINIVLKEKLLVTFANVIVVNLNGLRRIIYGAGAQTPDVFLRGTKELF